MLHQRDMSYCRDKNSVLLPGVTDVRIAPNVNQKLKSEKFSNQILVHWPEDSDMKKSQIFTIWSTHFGPTLLSMP